MTAIATPPPPIRDEDELPVLELHGESSSPWVLARDIWAQRELLVLLARKAFFVKYRRMSFGTLWAVALPLLQAAVMAIVFSHLVRFQIPHYAMFMLSGMTAWTYFSAVFAAGSVAITGGVDLSSKVYFPRAMLPMVQVLTNLYGFVIMLVIVLILSWPLGDPLGVRALLLIPGTLLLVLFSTCLTLTTSAVQVYFRDVGYIVTAAVMLLMYVSPVIYPPSLAPSIVKPILAINPTTGILDLFHAAFGASVPMGAALIVTGAWSALFLATAVALHSRFDRVFADLL